MCLDVFQLLARHLLFQGENKNEETPMHLLQCRYEFHRGIFVLECNSKTIQSLTTALSIQTQECQWINSSADGVSSPKPTKKAKTILVEKRKGTINDK